MSPGDFIDLKPGRELDALIAEKVMGWKKVLTPMGSRWERPVDHPAVNADAAECPNYSTDIAAAWEVVEKFKDGAIHKIYFPDPPTTEFVAVFKRDCQGYGKTAPHAICLAALKAVQLDEGPD